MDSSGARARLEAGGWRSEIGVWEHQPTGLNRETRELLIVHAGVEGGGTLWMWRFIFSLRTANRFYFVRLETDASSGERRPTGPC